MLVKQREAMIVYRAELLGLQNYLRLQTWLNTSAYFLESHYQYGIFGWSFHQLLKNGNRYGATKLAFLLLPIPVRFFSLSQPIP